MLTFEQLNQIRARIDAEYAKDIQALEALQRLSRFLPTETSEKSPDPVIEIEPDKHTRDSDPNATLLSGGSESILGGLEKIIRENSDRTWTSKQLKAELLARGYELLAKNPMATIGVSLKKLADRGRISVARYGAGREPHLYKWEVVKSDDCEYKPEESEAA